MLSDKPMLKILICIHLNLDDTNKDSKKITELLSYEKYYVNNVTNQINQKLSVRIIEKLIFIILLNYKLILGNLIQSSK